MRSVQKYRDLEVTEFILAKTLATSARRRNWCAMLTKTCTFFWRLTTGDYMWTSSFRGELTLLLSPGGASPAGEIVRVDSESDVSSHDESPSAKQAARMDLITCLCFRPAKFGLRLRFVRSDEIARWERGLLLLPTSRVVPYAVESIYLLSGILLQGQLGAILNF